MFYESRGRWLLAVSMAVSLVAAGCGQGTNVKYNVGHLTKFLDVIGTLGEHRPVRVEIWYPAKSLKGAGLSVYTSRIHGLSLLSIWDPLSWQLNAEVAREDARISNQGSPFPALIFSPGNQSNALDYAYTLERIAAYGFIVVGIDHLNNTQDDVRIDFINNQARFIQPDLTLIECFDGLPGRCERGADIRKSFTDRVRDVSAAIDALPTWFREHVDVNRVGMMGHSRGTVTSLAAAGGSETWGFPAEPRVKALMGLAIGAPAFVFSTNLSSVTIPALLVAGTLDVSSPAAVSEAALEALGSTDKELVLIPNALHRHFYSTLCDQQQNAAAIAMVSARAIADRQTASGLLTEFRPSGQPMDYCRFDQFTTPTDIRPFVKSITGVDVTPTSVPTHGLDSDTVKEQVVELAVTFFSAALGGRNGKAAIPHKYKVHPPPGPDSERPR